MINYKIGDATKPEGNGLKIIPHICNDLGAWGSGFVMALSKRWDGPESAYREWAGSGNMHLGGVQPVRVEDDITVLNMVAQHETIRTNPKPIDYEALLTCLEKVHKYCLVRYNQNPSIHMPRIGCDRARGKWEVVEALVRASLTCRDFPVEVTVYDLPHG